MALAFKILDRTLALLVALLVVVIHVGILREDSYYIGSIITFSVAILPSILLWLSHRNSMAILSVYGLCCCQIGYMSCDAGPNDPWGVLHVAHDWLWLLSPYAFIRLLLLICQRDKSATP